VLVMKDRIINIHRMMGLGLSTGRVRGGYGSYEARTQLPLQVIDPTQLFVGPEQLFPYPSRLVTGPDLITRPDYLTTSATTERGMLREETGR